MANAPCPGGTRESLKVFLPNREAKYFFERGWTFQANHLEPAREQTPNFAALNQLLAYWFAMA